MKTRTILTLLLFIVLSFSLCAQNTEPKVSPNPFTSKTTITLPETKSDNNVQLQIYNAKGQLVKKWPSEKGPSITWDGKDDNGKLVKNGIYFFKMIAGKYTSSKKIILMK